MEVGWGGLMGRQCGGGGWGWALAVVGEEGCEGEWVGGCMGGWVGGAEWTGRGVREGVGEWVVGRDGVVGRIGGWVVEWVGE